MLHSLIYHLKQQHIDVIIPIIKSIIMLINSTVHNIGKIAQKKVLPKQLDLVPNVFPNTNEQQLPSNPQTVFISKS